MFTFKQFLAKYPNNLACLKDIVNRKGLSCCGKLYLLKNRPVVICGQCQRQYSPLKGTIFEKSRTPLTSWFYAIYLMTKTKHGIPAKELQRELGVTYKTAWRMMNRIRAMMVCQSNFSDKVQVDETFVGGKGKNRASKYYGQGQEKKEIVLGIWGDNQVKTVHLPNLGKWTILGPIQAYVPPGATIFSDNYYAYNHLPKYGYGHFSVNHKIRFVEKTDDGGEIHTQNLENFWSHFKRGINGVYRQVSSKWLQSYANEFAFRYNHRDEEMFPLLLQSCVQPYLELD